MQAFIFNAAVFCEDCGVKAGEELSQRSIADNGDSDTYPQGPYEDGGGEADTPNHCDYCDVFLENPLTEDGNEYVREAYESERCTRNQSKSRRGIENTQLWANHYDYLGLPGKSYVVWFGHAGFESFTLGAALSCECYATVEEAQVESRRLELCPGDVLELIDCNPD